MAHTVPFFNVLVRYKNARDYAETMNTLADEGRPLRIGYVPQRLQFDRGMPLTVMEFMVMGRQRIPLWFGICRAHRDHARELLAFVESVKLK